MLSNDCSTKKCSQCGKQLPLSEEYWHKHKQTKDGFNNPCKNCRKARGQQYYSEHKEEVKAKVADYKKNNPERVIQSRRNSKKKNAAKVRETNQLYQHNNPDKRKVWGYRYRKNNKDKISILAAHRRARKKEAEGNYTSEQIIELYNLQLGLCFHCGANLTLTGYHKDHWIPLSRGGSNWIDNIRLLCPECNLSKSDKLPFEWSDRYH